MLILVSEGLILVSVFDGLDEKIPKILLDLVVADDDGEALEVEGGGGVTEEGGGGVAEEGGGGVTKEGGGGGEFVGGGGGVKDEG